jgi:hypothetical protein
VDPQKVLDTLATLRVTTWQYSDDPSAQRHMGPMAQDFRSAFGLGLSERRIDAVDANGVLTAAVQALRSNLIELRAENAELRAQNIAIAREVQRLKARGPSSAPGDPALGPNTPAHSPTREGSVRETGSSVWPSAAPRCASDAL